MSSVRPVSRAPAAAKAVAERKTPAKWSARRTVAFVVAASLLLWAVIIVLVMRLI